MGQDSKSRRRDLLAVNSNIELDAQRYARRLFLLNKEKYQRVALSKGFCMTDEELEQLCADIFREFWKSVGKCVYWEVEVAFPYNKKHILFYLTYCRRR